MIKDNILKKFFNFIKNIFGRKNKIKYIEAKKIDKENNKRESFINNLQESNNTENIIEKVLKDKSALYNMSLEELKQLNKAIRTKQENLNQMVMELKLKIANFN